MLSTGDTVTDFDGRPGETGARNGQLLDMLAKTLDRQVLPRVAAALPNGPALPRAARLCAERLVLGQADAVARALADIARSGAKPEQICLTLLTDIARELGRLWQDDRCSFVDVTLGVVQAQEALFRLAPGFAAAGAVHGRSLLIGAAPGETHGFGVSMVAEFFRHGGWVVAAEPLDDATDWERAVAGTWYDVVGVSIGTEDLLPRLRGLVQGIRARACNPMLAVMVGGPLLLQRPGIARDCGADATATDAADALRKAEALLRLPAKAA